MKTKILTIQKIQPASSEGQLAGLEASLLESLLGFAGWPWSLADFFGQVFSDKSIYKIINQQEAEVEQ